MLDDGDCTIAPANNSGGGVDDPRRLGEADVVISASVGVNGRNVADDVWNIQYGLDQVPPIDGGPDPQLKIDGLCGPKTIEAIRKFQQKHFGWAGCDGRIDPGRQTLAKLNEKRQRWIAPHLPLSLGVDGWLLADLLQHVPHTKACVQAAIATANDARSGGSGMALVDKHYRLSGTGGEVVGLTKMIGVYTNMLDILDRPEVYCTLDTTDEGETISTVAFAQLGGFFDRSNVTGKITFRRGAYFASGIPDFAAFVFIHEMRHYVEPSSDNGHHAKGWVTDPGMLMLGPDRTVFNCDTYAGFALESRNGQMQRPGWVRSTQFR